LSKAKIGAALKLANRRNVTARAEQIQAALRAPALRQPAAVQVPFAAITTGEVRNVTALNNEIAALGAVVSEHFGRHPDAEIYASQPGLGVVLGARVLGEFGDDWHRYADARARRNYAGTSPITRASGTKKVVLTRYARNDRLGTPSNDGPSAHSAAHPEPAPTTTPCEPARSATTPHCASSPTASSASCTAA
jgi:transposase